MKELQVDTLKTGYRFSQPVFIDENNILVPAMIPIKQKDLDRLKKWKIHVVRTAGDLLPCEGQGEAGTDPQTISFANYLKSPVQKEILTVYTGMLENFRRLQAEIKAQRPVEAAEVDRIVDSVFSLLRRHRDELIQFIFFGSQGESDSAANAVNCAVLSGLIGSAFNLPQHRLMQLMTGALLHDVGMLRVSDEIVGKKGALEPVELDKIKAHTIHSFRIISREMKYPQEIGMIALQHHERWDGEGYPKGIAGSKISLYSRIVAVADAFEAMISRRPYRNSMIGYAAMRALLSDNGRRFDPEVLKVFIKCMGIYPLGSVVLLSNSCIGRVVETNPDAPLRPKVKIMIDRDGAMVPNDQGEIVDLDAAKNVFIAKAVDPRNLAGSARG